MSIEELRSEFCKQKGWNFIEFETITQAEEYILFLENKVNNGVLDDVNQQRELLFAFEKMRTNHITEATDEWRYANVDLFLSKK